MRVTNEIKDISYNETKHFFEARAEKFNNMNPYSVTMYQDNNPELVTQRNKKETEKLLPKLSLNNASRVLDIACGIGRWSDAITCDIDEYCGVDFSDNLIKIADARNSDKNNRKFLVSGINEIREKMAGNQQNDYNVVLMIGILMYINDSDLENALNGIGELLAEHCTICVREPIGVGARLTLKDFYSDELKDDYNAIYRTHDELMSFFNKTFISQGFSIEEEGYLFENDGLNNRKETVQYYFIFRR